MSLNTSFTLLQKLKQKHDEQSWQRFVDYYRSYLFTVIRNMLFNEQDSEDLVQDVLLKAWQKLPEFDYDAGKGKFRWWLVTLTRNTALNFIKKKKKHLKNVSQLEQDTLAPYFDAVKLPEIEQIAEVEWKAFISNLAWDNIAENFSDAVKQSFKLSLEGLSISAISTQLEIEENTVSVYKKRVKDRLCREILRLEHELS